MPTLFCLPANLLFIPINYLMPCGNLSIVTFIQAGQVKGMNGLTEWLKDDQCWKLNVPGYLIFRKDIVNEKRCLVIEHGNRPISTSMLTTDHAIVTLCVLFLHPLSHTGVNL